VLAETGVEVDHYQYQPMLMAYIGIVTISAVIQWVDMIFNKPPELLEKLRNPTED